MVFYLFSLNKTSELIESKNVWAERNLEIISIQVTHLTETEASRGYMTLSIVSYYKREVTL